jgi:hypothetical protein
MKKLLAFALIVLGLSACAPGRPASAITVNGEAIGMDAYTNELSADKGSSTVAINALVRRAVIEQVGRDKNVNISSTVLSGAVRQVEQSAGGRTALEKQLAGQRLSRAQFVNLLRLRLLEQTLLRRDPTHYASTLGTALNDALVQVFVGPCTKDHAYPRCVLSH